VSRRERIVKELIVEPGTEANIAGRDPAWTGGPEFEELSAKELSHTAKALLHDGIKELSKAQELLWASDTYAVLVVFQALDAAGKDSTIEHVMSGVNPQGVHVVSFKQPSSEELDHDFLWRTVKALPERGRIGIFNRSHYEEVVALRVHPEWLDKQKLPPGPRGPEFWAGRHEDINAFERHLVRNGTIILKFFLNVSKKEQKRRFLERLENPEKHWKFSASDLAERGFWEQYTTAYEDAFRATSTEWAPWYIVPADHKWATRAIVADILTSAMLGLDLRYPEVTEEQQQALEQARQQLEHE
jgi:PPK2 family polyphosphate:nucleotide phosphotransferase